MRPTDPSPVWPGDAVTKRSLWATSPAGVKINLADPLGVKD